VVGLVSETKRLIEILEDATEIVDSWFPETRSDPVSRRISILAIAKMLVDLATAGIPAKAPVVPTPPKPLVSITARELETIPWQPDGPAHPERGRWIQRDTEGKITTYSKTDEQKEILRRIVATMGKKGQGARRTLLVGNVLYRFSGREKQFVNRRPIRR